jgi:hypothetical protein
MFTFSVYNARTGFSSGFCGKAGLNVPEQVEEKAVLSNGGLWC